MIETGDYGDDIIMGVSENGLRYASPLTRSKPMKKCLENTRHISKAVVQVGDKTTMYTLPTNRRMVQSSRYLTPEFACLYCTIIVSPRTIASKYLPGTSYILELTLNYAFAM